MDLDEICYEPIGVVHSPFETPEDVPRKPEGSTGATGRVEVDPRYEAGLDHLDGFSHVVLLTHLHLVEDYLLHAKPPFVDVDPGVFATRGPRRPNPIGLSIVRLRAVDGSTLCVSDLDLVDGTPLLDIKPHAPKPHEQEVERTGWLEDVSEDSAE